MFKLSQEWRFPTNDYGQIYGISDSGVETFKGTPMKSLAREICQNSLDANLHNGNPTRIEFSVFEIPSKKIPGYDDLLDAMKRALDFWSKQKSDKAKTFFARALTTIKAPTIKCLRISDFNTTGLIGSKEEYNSPWCNLIKSTGTSDKDGSNGGSFGIGKFAPFACSSLRTVFYSTADADGIFAHQGVTRLTSFKNKKNQTTQGTGFYGNEKNSPATHQFSLDPSYTRNSTDYGTDIFIVGFNGDESWQNQMIASILDGFLYAVYSNALEVTVDGIEINQATLPSLMTSYKSDFQEHADEYYLALTDDNVARTFERTLSDDKETEGKLMLRLMIMPEFHRRVAMIRQTGMKIKDKGNIHGLIPFAGVLFIEGDNINSFLRSLENPQHLDWEISRAEDDKEKARKAKRLLAYFTRFIKDSLNELKNDDSEEALDPSVGEYLSAAQEEDVSNIEKQEGIQDAIASVKIRVSDITPKYTGNQPSNVDNSDHSAVDDDNGDIIASDLPGEDGSGGKSPGGGGGQGGGDNPGSGGGNTPVDHRKKLVPIAPVSMRSVVRNKVSGEYTIVFTPSASASNGVIDIFMSAESQNYTANIISASCSDCADLTFNKNQITGLSFKERQPLRLNIQLDYHDYCSLEVKAYGNKV